MAAQCSSGATQSVGQFPFVLPVNRGVVKSAMKLKERHLSVLCVLSGFAWFVVQILGTFKGVCLCVPSVKMIEQEYAELQWIIVGTTALWVLDVLYRNIVERKDGYRYILLTSIIASLTILPSKWQMVYVLCRYWYSTFRLGPRIGFLYNTHAIMMILYMCYMALDESLVHTWYFLFSCIDMCILLRSFPKPLKLLLWVLVRIVAFGIYTLFFSPTLFMKVYFGFLWMTQVFMIKQLV